MPLVSIKRFFLFLNTPVQIDERENVGDDLHSSDPLNVGNSIKRYEKYFYDYDPFLTIFLGIMVTGWLSSIWPLLISMGINIACVSLLVKNRLLFRPQSRIIARTRSGYIFILILVEITTIIGIMGWVLFEGLSLHF